MRTFACTLILALTALAASGCGGPKTVWVTGKLLKGGVPFTPPDGQTVGVTFLAIDAKNEPYAAELSATDATFTVPGRDGRGVPPGKYRVSVVRKPKRGAQKLEDSPKGQFVKPDTDRDYLKGQFGPTTSPIIRELTASTDLTIDLDNPAQ